MSGATHDSYFGLSDQPPKQSNLHNPLLQQVEMKIESTLAPRNADNINKIVTAGQRSALAKGPDGLMKGFRLSQDPIMDAAKGAVGLVFVLRNEAKGVAPEQALEKAAALLLLRALDFIGLIRRMPIGENEVNRAIRLMTDMFMNRFGITKDVLTNLAQRTHQIMRDPQAMRAINAKAGLPTPGGQ